MKPIETSAGASGISATGIEFFVPVPVTIMNASAHDAAKVLMPWRMTKPGGWITQPSQVVSIGLLPSVASARNAIESAVESGWLVRETVRQGGGRFGAASERCLLALSVPFVKVPLAIWLSQDLSPRAKLVWALAQYTGGVVQSQIAATLNMHRQTAAAISLELMARGLAGMDGGRLVALDVEKPASGKIDIEATEDVEKPACGDFDIRADVENPASGKIDMSPDIKVRNPTGRRTDVEKSTNGKTAFHVEKSTSGKTAIHVENPPPIVRDSKELEKRKDSDSSLRSESAAEPEQSIEFEDSKTRKADLPAAEPAPRPIPLVPVESERLATCTALVPAATLEPMASDSEFVDTTTHFRDATGEVRILRGDTIEATLPGEKPERVGLALLRKDKPHASREDLVRFAFATACAWLSDHEDEDGKRYRLAQRLRAAVKHGFDAWLANEAAGAVEAIAGPGADKTDREIAAAAHRRGVTLTDPARRFLRKILALPMGAGISPDLWLDESVEVLAGDRYTEEVGRQMSAALTKATFIRWRPAPKELAAVVDKAIKSIEAANRLYGPVDSRAAVYARYDSAATKLAEAKAAAARLHALGEPIDSALTIRYREKWEPESNEVRFVPRHAEKHDLFEPGTKTSGYTDDVMRFAYHCDGASWPSWFSPTLESARPGAIIFSWPEPPKPQKPREY